MREISKAIYPRYTKIILAVCLVASLGFAVGFTDLYTRMLFVILTAVIVLVGILGYRTFLKRMMGRFEAVSKDGTLPLEYTFGDRDIDIKNLRKGTRQSLSYSEFYRLIRTERYFLPVAKGGQFIAIERSDSNVLLALDKLREKNPALK